MHLIFGIRTISCFKCALDSDAIFVYRYDLFPRLTLNEIIDLLNELDGETNIGVNPPIEDPENNTDEDSDDSDDEVRGNLGHFLSP